MTEHVYCTRSITTPMHPDFVNHSMYVYVVAMLAAGYLKIQKKRNIQLLFEICCIIAGRKLLLEHECIVRNTTLV